MQKDLNYYMNLDYPFECYCGENEVGDAFLVEFIDFEIKGASEDYDEAVALAHEYLAKHIQKELALGKELPNPGEGVRFMRHREALNAYKQKDFAKAKSIWEEESQLKNDQAMANLGLMYLKGEGVNKDFAKAKEYFEAASLYDNDSANFNLALMYQSKIGVEEDMPKAKEYFRRAIAKNHTQAAFRLALLLLQDRSHVENVKEGFYCMLTAAKNGHAMACIQLAGLDKELIQECELNRAFRAKSLEAQLEIINDALDRFIRPMLIKDGGNILLIDYITQPEIELRLAYQGACAGCSMASTGTYEMIKNTLEQVIDKKFRLYIL
jgi:Fe-S cluster biogenesis protein NfuA